MYVVTNEKSAIKSYSDEEVIITKNFDDMLLFKTFGDAARAAIDVNNKLNSTYKVTSVAV